MKDEIGSILNILRSGNGVMVITGTETSVSTPRNLAEYLAKIKNVVNSNTPEDSYDFIFIKNCPFIRKNLGYTRQASDKYAGPYTYKSCYTQGRFSTKVSKIVYNSHDCRHGTKLSVLQDSSKKQFSG